MKVAIVGDSFIDKYCFGEVNRISPEAPVPVLDINEVEYRGGGAMNVANNLYGLGIEPTLFTITNQKAPYEIVSPKNATPLVKTRYIADYQQLLRVDTPKRYLEEDLKRAIYPDNYDLVAFVDYNKGLIKGGKADIIDTKKEDLSVFKGSKVLKVNNKEYNSAFNCDHFHQAFITRGKKGIDYYEKGKLVSNSPAEIREVIDITGAGDTVMAIVIYCLVNGITNPKEIMRLANKGAGKVIGKFGTSVITKSELTK